MGNRYVSSHWKKPMRDASTIAHASVIGVEGSVNNPDCLPAQSRRTTSKRRLVSRNSLESASGVLNTCRRKSWPRRTYIRNEETRKTTRDTGRGGYRTSDRSRDERATARRDSPRTIVACRSVITCSSRRIDSLRLVTRSSSTDRRRGDGARRSSPLAREYERKHSPRFPRSRRSFGRLRAPQLHHSTRTHTLYLCSRRWY